jgi:hypothetical protein
LCLPAPDILLDDFNSFIQCFKADTGTGPEIGRHSRLPSRCLKIYQEQSSYCQKATLIKQTKNESPQSVQWVFLQD